MITTVAMPGLEPGDLLLSRRDIAYWDRGSNAATRVFPTLHEGQPFLVLAVFRGGNSDLRLYGLGHTDHGCIPVWVYRRSLKSMGWEVE